MSRSPSSSSSLPAADKAFAGLFWSQVASDDLSLMSPTDRRRVVETHKALSTRRQGEVAISFAVVQGKTKKWQDRCTYLDIVADDAAFLIDSISALLGAHHYLIDLLLHPRMPVCVSDKGRVTFDPQGTHRASHMHVVIRGVLNAAQQAQIEEELSHVVRDVQDATRDWQRMRVRAIETKQYLLQAPDAQFSAEEKTEFAEFLDYVYDNNFTFLGCRQYKFVRNGQKVISEVVKGSGLGLLSDDRFPAYISETGQPLPQKLQQLRTQLPALHIGKVNRISTVHRRVPLDAVTVHHFNEKGEVVGETLFIGLFTSVTYSRSLRSIPLLKFKADMVMRQSGFEPASHDGRALRHILEKYPRDELFQTNIEDLQKTCLSILRLQERQRIALYCRSDLFGRYVSCLVYVPRDRYETRLRLKFQHILEEELGGVSQNFSSSVDDSPLVRILFTIAVSQDQPKSFDPQKVEERLQAAGRGWGDLLADELHGSMEDDAQSDRLTAAYAEAFSPDYRERYTLTDARADIYKIEACLWKSCLQMDLKPAANGALSLKLYTLNDALILSDILPVLENIGLRVLTEHPFVVQPQGSAQRVVMHDFTLTGETRVLFDDLKPVFEEALAGILSGIYENDTLNTLTMRMGLPARRVMILRAYVRYLRQAGLPFSLPYLEQAFNAYPMLAAQFVDLFITRFDPRLKAHKVDAIRSAIDAGLDAVVALDHDRILRACYMALQATLRTNYFQTEEDGTPKSYLAIKFDSRAMDFLPSPKPYREIFVYAVRMEGIHLRNGRIARGGIRWSDRAEDFRAEILGLMKAQTVKNSVIVPSGAKGGFIVKRPPTGGDRATMQAEGIACYQMLIRGLLDITDTYNAAGKVVHPPHVQILDGEDPYLVVAADKGTATFSDIANKLSLEYGFWTGDAFASGGSAGYDHKAMGITARGAWESVKRHFREMGIDTQAQAFDVIGIGDMGGDVFGNGALLSPFICLVGAFNHAHIFCDPNPDPKTSFAERMRLFRGVMGWDQYNTKLLSKGGRIYSRKDKVLDLTPEIQKRFDLPKAKVSPPELIQALLRARADLMYLGGIGTYIKASHESHADASDRSNDALRVNANELRVRVVAEGANLGLTQNARVEFALSGGRVNADFIDNSAGVDTSDHEVNIKILCAGLMKQKPAKLTGPARDKMLRAMTDDVAALVLRDNYQQTQAISLQERSAAEFLSGHQKLMQDLEREKLLDRTLEFLPDDKAIAVRRAAGQGLTRPEIGILLSYAKLKLRDGLLASGGLDSPDMRDILLDYFPLALQTKYSTDIFKHPLRREIVATALSNAMVNRLGPTCVDQMIENENVSAGAAARAFVVVSRLLDLPARYRAAEALDGRSPALVQMTALRDLSVLLERLMVWILRTYGNDVDVEKALRSWQKPIDQLAQMLVQEKSVKKLFTPAQVQSWHDRCQGWAKANVPADLTAFLSNRTKLSLAPSVFDVAATTRRSLEESAGVYYKLGDLFAFGFLRVQIDNLPKADQWAAAAAVSMQEKMDRCQRDLACAILRRVPAKGDPLESWMRVHEQAAHGVFVLIADLKRQGLKDLSILMVLIQKIEKLMN